MADEKHTSAEKVPANKPSWQQWPAERDDLPAPESEQQWRVTMADLIAYRKRRGTFAI